VADEPAYLAARAKWCRRLARDSADSRIQTSLEDLAQELEDRAEKTNDQA
jgi:hypothetical protein